MQTGCWCFAFTPNSKCYIWGELSLSFWKLLCLALEPEVSRHLHSLHVLTCKFSSYIFFFPCLGQLWCLIYTISRMTPWNWANITIHGTFLVVLSFLFPFPHFPTNFLFFFLVTLPNISISCELFPGICFWGAQPKSGTNILKQLDY